ncbi:MAG: cupin domain-containing protein [Opitutaceae bacterium]|nr:cupin domain-containing protein [Opitutaceae bacterium]
MYLRIQGGGRADTHWHFGDELLIVTSGEIDFSLPKYGMRSTLRQGDMVHFHAEQIHTAYSTNQSGAEVLAFRMFSTRRLDRERVLKSIGHQYANLVLSESELHVSDNIMRYDPIAFAHLLRTYKGGKTLSEIAEAFRQLNVDRSRQDVWKLLNGRPIRGFSEPDVICLQKILNIPEIVALGYLVEAAPSFIIVDHNRDYSDKFNNTLGGRDLGSEYRLPSRRLLGASVQIMQLALPPDARVPKAPHSHPGFEFIWPLRGAAKVQIGPNTPKIVKADDKSFVIFDSTQPHFVESVSCSEGADLLVVRFLQGPPGRGE